MAKILILGGTGAMGVYLVPELINMGFDVYVTSRSFIKSNEHNITYIQGDAHDDEFIKKTVEYKYDAIIDFMIYSTNEFYDRYVTLLKNTKHYIFLSSYRVFADSNLPITENSPRLLDVSTDTQYLKTDEYALAKARQENILRESLYKNWTIVRPTITYSKTRFQLCSLEANTFIFRAFCNCPVILPQEMLQKQTTMTWAGDVAKMIAKLTLNQNAFCEDFNVCTDEHQTWEDVAVVYKKLIGLNIMPVNLIKYIKVVGSKYQILYDRMYDRVMDNSKIILATGIQRECLMSIHNGLAKELSDYSDLFQTIKPNYEINAKMDRLTHHRINIEKASIKDKLVYFSSLIGISTYLRYTKKMVESVLPK